MSLQKSIGSIRSAKLRRGNIRSKRHLDSGPHKHPPPRAARPRVQDAKRTQASRGAAPSRDRYGPRPVFSLCGKRRYQIPSIGTVQAHRRNIRLRQGHQNDRGKAFADIQRAVASSILATAHFLVLLLLLLFFFFLFFTTAQPPPPTSWRHSGCKRRGGRR